MRDLSRIGETFSFWQKEKLYQKNLFGKEKFL
jgi:hypothetical protein